MIDDPIASDAERWTRAARKAGAIVVTVHDSGLGAKNADLVVDGSVTRARKAVRGAKVLAGTRFAVLDPGSHRRNRRRRSRTPRVLIALGGGPHLRRAEAIAETIAAANPRAEIRIAGGFVSSPARRSTPRVRWIGSLRGLVTELAKATVAVVGGGVSLYEAAAMGVPAVTVPVVRSQVPTVLAFARHRAAIAVPYTAPPKAAAVAVVELLQGCVAAAFAGSPLAPDRRRPRRDPRRRRGHEAGSGRPPVNRAVPIESPELPVWQYGTGAHRHRRLSIGRAAGAVRAA